MFFRSTYWAALGFSGLLAVEVFARSDPYTAGFYTRGSDVASQIDQGGTLDPFYIPVQAWAFLPRVTLAATHDDNFFMTRQNQQAQTALRLIPGALLIYGRPEHNHLYMDTGISIPVYESLSSGNQGNSYLITAGGVYTTGKTQISGRLGHRRTETADVVADARVVDQDVIGDAGIEHRVSTKTSLGLNGSAELHNFGNPGYVNYVRYYGSGRIYRPMIAHSEWFLQGGIGRDELEKALPGVYGNDTFYDLSVGVRGKPSPKTSVSGRVGYRWQAYEDTSITNVACWIANLSAEATPFGLSTFSAEVTADMRPDTTGSGTSTVNQRLTVGVNRRLFTERLRGNASVLGGRVDYYGTKGVLEDEYWGFNLALDWWTRKNLSFGAAYSYTEKWSVDGGSAAYESGLWSLRMSWNY